MLFVAGHKATSVPDPGVHIKSLLVRTHKASFGLMLHNRILVSLRLKLLGVWTPLDCHCWQHGSLLCVDVRPLRPEGYFGRSGFGMMKYFLQFLRCRLWTCVQERTSNLWRRNSKTSYMRRTCRMLRIVLLACIRKSNLHFFHYE